MTCNSIHLRRILENSDSNFLPSVAIMLMHYNKTKEYYNCYTKLGRLPFSLKNKTDQLKKIIISYYNTYKDMDENLQNLYLHNPNNLKFMNIQGGNSTTVNLFEISHKISR